MDLGPQLWIHRGGGSAAQAPSAAKFEAPTVVAKYPRAKPHGGLWTSSWLGEEHGSDWVQWCLEERFQVPRDGWRGYLLEPREDARIYEIDTLADLERLLEMASHEWPAEDTKPHWADLAPRFDAIHLTEEGQWRTRMPMDLDNPMNLLPDLYGWDCESTLWLNWCFDVITELPRMKFKRAAEAACAGQ